VKPTSIIFIIVSAVLIIAGFVIMGFASQMDTELTATAGGSDYVVEYADDINRIEIDVKNANIIIKSAAQKGSSDDRSDIASAETTSAETTSAETASAETASADETAAAETDGTDEPSEDAPANIVTVTSGSDHVKITMKNFVEGFYECKYSGRVVSVKDNYDIGSIGGAFSVITNFKGFRHYLDYPSVSKLEKEIIIEISGDVRVNCSVLEGDVTVEGLRSAEPCNVRIGKGDLLLKNSSLVYTSGAFEPTRGEFTACVKDGDVRIENGEYARYTVSLGAAAYKMASSASEKKEEKSPYEDGFNDVIAAEYDINRYTAQTKSGTLTFIGESSVVCRPDIKYEKKGIKP